MRFEFPSEAAPGPTKVSLEAPDNWEATTLSGAALAVVGPTAEGDFRPNVVVTIDRVPGGSLAGATEELRASLDQLPEVEQIGAMEVTLNGCAGFAIEVAYRDPRAGTLVQTHRLVAVTAGTAVDVVHAVGSCAGDAVSEDLGVVRDVADSLAVAPA